VTVTDGRIVTEAIRAAEECRVSLGLHVGIILLERIKPYEEMAQKISTLLPKYPIRLLFLEEEIRAGGMGMMLSDILVRNHADVMHDKDVVILAPEDDFVIREREESVLDTAGVSAFKIISALKQ
jgi:transketolase C-terminal domain/subunit